MDHEVSLSVIVIKCNYYKYLLCCDTYNICHHYQRLRKLVVETSVYHFIVDCQVPDWSNTTQAIPAQYFAGACTGGLPCSRK